MFCNSSSSPGTYIEDIVFVTGYIIVALLVFVTNLLTVLTFILNRSLRKRAVYCVINLAVGDMLVGLGSTITACVVLWMYGLNGVVDRDIFTCVNPWTNVLAVVYFIFIAITVASLTLVAVERMIAILFPVRHRNSSVWLIPVLLTITWASVAFCGVFSMLCLTSTGFQNAEKCFTYFSTVGICGVLVTITISYVSILVKVNTNNATADTRMSTRDKGLALTLFIVTVASLIAWVPLGLLYFLRLFTDLNVPSIAHLISVFIGLFNSLINPLIYAYRLKDFSRAFRQLVCRCSRDRPTRVMPKDD